MSAKYSSDQLQEMARQWLGLWQRNDARALELVMRLSIRTGVNPTDCIRRITAMANGGAA